MTQDHTTQILSVNGRALNSGSTVWDVALGTGFSAGTFKAELATKAQQFVGQQAQVRVRLKDNGYYDLIDIAAVGQPLTTPQQGGGGGGRRGGGGMSPEDKLRATRLSAASTAASLLSTRLGSGEAIADVIGDFRALAEEVVNFGYSGKWGETGTPAGAIPAPEAVTPQIAPMQAPATPQAIAAAVPGVQVGAPDAAASSVPWDQPVTA